MSIGFSISDFAVAAKLAKTIYEAICDGPRDFVELKCELKSMQYALHSLRQNVKDPTSLLNRKGSSRRTELLDMMKNCENTMRELQNLVQKHSFLQTSHGNHVRRVWHNYRVGRADLDSLRGRLTVHTSIIDVFLASLQGATLNRIESKLDKMFRRLLTEDAVSSRMSSQESLVSNLSVLSMIDTNDHDVWERLKDELLSSGITMAHIKAHRQQILDCVRSLLNKERSSLGSTLPDTATAFFAGQIDYTKEDQLADKPGTESSDRDSTGTGTAEGFSPPIEASVMPSKALAIDTSGVSYPRTSSQLLNESPHRTEDLLGIVPNKILLVKQQYGLYKEIPTSMMIFNIALHSNIPSKDTQLKYKLHVLTTSGQRQQASGQRPTLAQVNPDMNTDNGPDSNLGVVKLTLVAGETSMKLTTEFSPFLFLSLPTLASHPPVEVILPSDSVSLAVCSIQFQVGMMVHHYGLKSEVDILTHYQIPSTNIMRPDDVVYSKWHREAGSIEPSVTSKLVLEDETFKHYVKNDLVHDPANYVIRNILLG